MCACFQEGSSGYSPSIPPRRGEGEGETKSRSRGLKTLQDLFKRLQKATKMFKITEIVDSKMWLMPNIQTSYLLPADFPKFLD